MGKDYGSWCLVDLKNELRKRNAKATGKKAVLVQRLADYDKLFGPVVTDPETVYKIIVPGPEHFRDVTSGSPLPALDIEEIHSFCRLTERDDISKSYNMYEENFLTSCRIAIKDRESYITGMVKSEFRKNIFYNVTLILKHHLILEAQCECAAGMEPYAQCKHAIVVLFAIVDMNKTKYIKLKESATDILQTFHQPKQRYTGDPIRVEELSLKFTDSKYKEIVSFDPRTIIEAPVDYERKFLNDVANFCCQSKNTCKAIMPMAQLIKPADKKTIFMDHDYLDLTEEENFLESTKLTYEERDLLQEKTKYNKKAWKHERLFRMHSSNFGKICKSKSGGEKLAKSLVKNTDILTPAMKHGLKYEDEAAREFEKQMGEVTQKCGIVVHMEHQYLASTPDRLFMENCVIEIKCPYTARGQMISPETVSYLYLCDKTGLLKLNEGHDYYYQVQGQMLCTERQMAFFCIYTISDFKIINIKRNDQFIIKMFEKLQKFYNDHFKNVILKRFLYNKK